MPARRRNRIIIIVLAVWVILTVFREAGWITLNWYNSNLEFKTTSTWSDQSTLVDIPKRLLGDSAINACNYTSITEVPVQVWIDDFLVGDTVDCQQLSAFSQDVHYGFLYAPLYKYTHYSVTVPVNCSVTLYVPHDTMVTVHSYSISGTVNIDGHASIGGVCAARKARAIIRESIAQDVYKQIVDHIHTLQ